MSDVFKKVDVHTVDHILGAEIVAAQISAGKIEKLRLQRDGKEYSLNLYQSEPPYSLGVGGMVQVTPHNSQPGYLSMWNVRIEYREQDGDRNVGHLDSNYHQPNGAAEAVIDALRWACNRCDCWQWTLLAMKVHAIRVGPITADGMTQTRSSLHCFEWKHDTGGALHQTVESYAAERRTKDAKIRGQS